MRRIIDDNHENSWYLNTLAGHKSPRRHFEQLKVGSPPDFEQKAVVKLFKQLRDSEEIKEANIQISSTDISMPSFDVRTGSIDEKLEKMVMFINPPGKCFIENSERHVG